MMRRCGDVDAAWLLAAVLLAGCGPAAQAVGDAGAMDADVQAHDLEVTDVASDAATDMSQDLASDTPATASADSVCRQAIATQCLRHLACHNYEEETCNSFGRLCPDYYFGANSGRTVAGIGECLSALARMTCTDIAMGITPACLNVPGKAPAGAACVYATECQIYCKSDTFNSCGICLDGMTAGTGQACDATHRCDPTDYCHNATRTCASKASIVYATEGQACDFLAVPSVGCVGDLLCAHSSSTATEGTCRPMPKAGEPCVLDGSGIYGPLCGPDLACVKMVCTAAVPSCGDAPPCASTSFCRTVDAVSTCVPLAAEGQPCRRTSPELRCDSNLRCGMALDAGENGICVKPGESGDSCNDVTRPCAGDLRCMNSVCRVFDRAACPAGTLDAGDNG